MENKLDLILLRLEQLILMQSNILTNETLSEWKHSIILEIEKSHLEKQESPVNPNGFPKEILPKAKVDIPNDFDFSVLFSWVKRLTKIELVLLITISFVLFVLFLI